MSNGGRARLKRNAGAFRRSVESGVECSTVEAWEPVPCSLGQSAASPHTHTYTHQRRAMEGGCCRGLLPQRRQLQGHPTNIISSSTGTAQSEPHCQWNYTLPGYPAPHGPSSLAGTEPLDRFVVAPSSTRTHSMVQPLSSDQTVQSLSVALRQKPDMKP